MENQDFKEGDIVCLEIGTKGKIISIEKPLGTYCIYNVQSLQDGTVKRKARHQLIKYISDDAFECEEAPGIDDQLLMGLFEGELDLGVNENNIQDIAVQTAIASNPLPDPRPPVPPRDQNRFIPMNESEINEFMEQNEYKTLEKKTTLGHIELAQAYLNNWTPQTSTSTCLNSLSWSDKKTTPSINRPSYEVSWALLNDTSKDTNTEQVLFVKLHFPLQEPL